MFVAQLVKNPPAMWEIWVRSLGWEDPLEKGVVWPREFYELYIVHGVSKSRTRLSDFLKFGHAMRIVVP